ncbi:MAG: hypothetical protein JO096_06705 [Alphaproteobacteria bacterium]|nr:hypothetical protein [Alphaproteobacteria bacterium]MBV9686883.1 hypothetical protein [Alphaproteobacteria bacterium]
MHGLPQAVSALAAGVNTPGGGLNPRGLGLEALNASTRRDLFEILEHVAR